VSGFYLTYIGAAAIAFFAFTLMMAGLLGAAMAAALVNPEGLPAEGPPPELGLAIMGPVLLIYFVGVLTAHAFVSSRIRNLCWSHTTLGPHRFGSRMRARRLLWITLGNAVATICTLGLFWPFAQVRLARYAAATFWMQPAGPLDQFVAAREGDVGAVGEEVAEFFDFDIAF
jgi:uncharacterized membrane protein YjgN (DUF898 family)